MTDLVPRLWLVTAQRKDPFAVVNFVWALTAYTPAGAKQKVIDQDSHWLPEQLSVHAVQGEIAMYAHATAHLR